MLLKSEHEFGFVKSEFVLTENLASVVPSFWPFRCV